MSPNRRDNKLFFLLYFLFISFSFNTFSQVSPLMDVVNLKRICDVIEIRIKRRDCNDASGKGNQPLNIKTAVKRRPIVKLGLTNFRWNFYFILLIVASFLFRRFFYDVTHDTFQLLFFLLVNIWLYSLWLKFTFLFYVSFEKNILVYIWLIYLFH